MPNPPPRVCVHHSLLTYTIAALPFQSQNPNFVAKRIVRRETLYSRKCRSVLVRYWLEGEGARVVADLGFLEREVQVQADYCRACIVTSCQVWLVTRSASLVLLSAKNILLFWQLHLSPELQLWCCFKGWCKISPLWQPPIGNATHVEYVQQQLKFALTKILTTVTS